MAEQANATGARRRRSSEELRQVVLDAAAEEFRTAGYASATTAAIARRAQTTEAQLFRYFPAKAELFREAMLRPLDRHLQEFTQRATTAGDDAAAHGQQARDYITELQAFIAEHERMFLSLITAEHARDGKVAGMASVDALHDYFARGAATMRARTGDAGRIAPELMVRISFAAVLGCTLFKDWLYPEGMADEVKVREAVIRFVTDGLYAAQPEPATNAPNTTGKDAER